MASPLAATDALSRLDVGRTVRFGAAAGAVCFLVSAVPYVFGFLATPADRVYLGLLFDAPDHAQYWSWVTASRERLFIPNTMTPEPNAPVFLNPWMWALARVQTAFDLSFPALFQVWRLAAALLMGAALAVMSEVLARSRPAARTAFWIALLGAGLGWVLIGVKYAAGLADAPYPEAIYTVEPNTWFGLQAYPYLPLGQAFMLIALAGAFRSHLHASPRAYAAAGLGALGVALVHAYDLVIVYVVLGAFWALETYRVRRMPAGLTLAIVLIVACSAPLAFYYQYLTSTDALWQSILAQYVNAGVWTPSPPLLVVLVGAPLLLAIARLRGADWTDPRLRFTACWAIVGGVLAYAPTVFQVKLLAAWQVPLAVLAADLWSERIAPRIAEAADRAGIRRPLTPWAPAVLLAALILPTNAYLFAWRLLELRRPDAPYYLTVDEAAALDAVALHSEETDVALAIEPVGRWIPNYGRTRAFLAHWAMTNRYFERREAVDSFFSTGVDDRWRANLLEAEGVTLVVWTVRALERDLTFTPASSPLFEPVFASPTAGVFRLRLDRP